MIKLSVSTVTILFLCFFNMVKSAKQFAYVGLYTTLGNNKNMSRADPTVFEVSVSSDGEIGNFTAFSNTPPDVSWILQHPKINVVYALSESGSSVSAYMVKSHKWELLNKVETGQGPVYLSIDHNGKFLFVAQYNSGYLAVYSLQDDGSFGKLTDKHNQGFGTHSIVINPKDEKFVFSPVLGLDKVNQWVFSNNTGKLTPNDNADTLQLGSGFGPRHMVFHPSLPLAYISDEGNETTPARLTVCKYDSNKGTLTSIRSYSTISHGVNSTFMYPAEILISENGKFIYVSNRDGSLLKRDSIATFRVNGTNLIFCGESSTGWYPRSMSMSANGKILIVGNQKDSSVISFMVNKVTGALTRTSSIQKFNNNVAFVGFLNN